MLWASWEELVKSTVALPALAVRVLLVNLSCPLGSAESLIVLPPPPPPDDELDEEEDDVEAGALDDEVLLLLLEPPHAASPSVTATATRDRAEILGTCVPLVRDPDPA
jgi:hypothetical protein